MCIKFCTIKYTTRSAAKYAESLMMGVGIWIRCKRNPNPSCKIRNLNLCTTFPEWSDSSHLLPFTFSQSPGWPKTLPYNPQGVLLSARAVDCNPTVCTFQKHSIKFWKNIPRLKASRQRTTDGSVYLNSCRINQHSMTQRISLDNYWPVNENEKKLPMKRHICKHRG